jgi:phosphatidylserine decarboxylase
VNPVALARVQELFCKNERAVLHMETQEGVPFLIVPVAAVLVASMRFHAVDVLLNLRYKGPNEMPCDAAYAKGQEMGWFEHGSTILVFVPKGFALAPGILLGQRIQMGQALLSKL